MKADAMSGCAQSGCTWREQSGWPAYRILTDTVLRDVARLAPATIEQLNGIVGEAKAKKYGQQLLLAMSAVDH